jgi:hypothetical protein
MTLLYSSHLRNKRSQGIPLDTTEEIVANHPLISSVGLGLGLRHVLKNPTVQEIGKDLIGKAGKTVEDVGRAVQVKAT